MIEPVADLGDTTSVLAVCAHPDDESFGLGAVISTLRTRGIDVDLVCFTHGEASTLGADTGDLAAVRARELRDAARVLGVRELTLLDHADGALASVPLDLLADQAMAAAARHHSDLLLVFDEGGITGHPDHRHATAAACRVADRTGLPVLAWTLPASVATSLDEQFGVPFVGRETDDIGLVLDVDRSVQRRAIACHRTQATDNPVLRRRLELQGDQEVLVWLRRRRAPDQPIG